MTTISTKKINMIIYFENLTIEFHVIYVFNMHVKFLVNWILIYYSIYKLIFYT